MARIYDISAALDTGTACWPDDVPFRRFNDKKNSIPKVSAFQMGCHTGTHIDVPAHYLPGGAAISDMDPEIFYGSARVIDARGKKTVTAAIIAEQLLDGDRRVLFKTDNSNREDNFSQFHKTYVHLASDAAELLVHHGVVLVGMDAMSVDAYDDERAVCHHILLEAGIAILETITLRDVAPGGYTLSCGPLNIIGTEAAPCRAVLIENA